MPDASLSTKSLGGHKLMEAKRAAISTAKSCRDWCVCRNCHVISDLMRPHFERCQAGIAHFAKSKPVNAMTLFEFLRP
jgi:hypothetical protein